MIKPSAWILFLALVSLGISVYFWQNGNIAQATYIGLWVPSLIAAATYFKTR